MIIGGKMLKQKYLFRVEFFDVDSMGLVWHGNYVKYLEMARCRLLDSVGFNYIKMRENGFALPIVKMDLKYIQPLWFNEEFEVEIVLQECDVFLRFDYCIVNKKHKKVCIAQTSQVAVTLKGETLYEIPKELHDSLRIS